MNLGKRQAARKMEVSTLELLEELLKLNPEKVRILNDLLDLCILKQQGKMPAAALEPFEELCGWIQKKHAELR
jgi:hypothetical protein